MLENKNRLMYSADAEGSGYGYGEDTDAKVSPFNFGGNFGVAKLTKFEWIPNGGKDGAEQEALEIVFNINGTDRSYRQFPVVKAFDKNQAEVTDPSSPEMKKAISEFNARMTHVVHAFVDDAAIKQAFAKPGRPTFKQYCDTLKSLLPKNTPEIALDIFMQYQWSLKGEANRTYLDIPTKRSHGSFLVKSVAPVGGNWTAVKAENPDDNMADALHYVDGAGNKHPFVRTGWFMNSNFAIQQKIGGDSSDSSSNVEQASAMNGVASNDAPAATEQVASTW